MNALKGLFILAGIIYGVFYDGTFWKIYAACFVAYLLFVYISQVRRDNGMRQTLIISTWSQPSDPTSYIIADINMTKALAYCKKLNEEQKLLGDQGVRVTMTNLMGYALAHALFKMRRNVGRIKWGFFKHDKKCGTTLLADVGNGKDLVPVTIWDGHKISLLEFAKYINDKVIRAKSGKDEEHKKSTASAGFLPSFIIQPILFVATYLSICCGWTINALSLRSDRFGHAVLTNIGTLGFEQGFAPLCPPMHSIGLLCTGAIIKKPIVDKVTG